MDRASCSRLIQGLQLVISEETYRRVTGGHCSGNWRAEDRLVVAKDSGPSLLGRDWLWKIKLNWHEVKYTNITEGILQ